MTADQRAERLAVYNLDEEKVQKMIDRAAQACLAFSKGEMTIKQVWYRARGERFMMACQFHPDRELGFKLWALGDELYTGYHPDGEWADQIVHDSIFHVVREVQKPAGAIH